MTGESQSGKKPQRRPMADGITLAIITATVALVLLNVVGVVVFGSIFGFKETKELGAEPWVQPTAQSFIILSAIAIALLCLGRYRALGGAWVYWTGAVFLANGLLGIFYLLSWPGLAGTTGVIGNPPNTASWFYFMTYTWLALLLVTSVARRPERLRPLYSLAGYAITVVVTVLIGLLSLLFEQQLPVLIAGVVFTPLSLLWQGVLVAATAVGAVSVYRRYRTDKDLMLGYLALFLIIMSFGLLDTIMGGKRYDFWWYASRFMYIPAYGVILFGFLQEGYVLFGRERERLEERESLLGEVANLAGVTQRRVGELETILESIADAVFVCDAEGHITMANHVALSMLGAEESEAQRTLVDYLESLQLQDRNGRRLPLEELAISQVLHGGVVRGRDEVAVHPQTHRRMDLLISAAPLRDEAGHVVGAVEVATDITRVRELSEEAQRRAAELDAANKELEAFAYSVSHDLRAPLRHIDGFSRILQQTYADKLDERGQQYLQFLRDGSQKMGQLIDDLLRLSRVTRAEMRRQPVNLSELAATILTELRKEEPRRQLEMTIATGVVARGDPQLLRVALENLLGNAWKFTSQRPVAEIEFGVTSQDGKLVYFVKDNGAGFDMVYTDKLFGAFQRLHRAEEYPGTGIGLATVQRIIQRHGGRVWAEGEVGKGATFYFTLT